MKINESPHSETIYWMMVIYWCLEHTSKQVLPSLQTLFDRLFNSVFCCCCCSEQCFGLFWQLEVLKWTRGISQMRGVTKLMWEKADGSCRRRHGELRGGGGRRMTTGGNIRLCLHAAPAQFLLLLHLLTDGSWLCGRCRYHCHRISPPVQTLKGLY